VSTDASSIATELPADLRAAAQQIAQVPNLLVCIDFDGTLAPIVEDPALARALPESVSALTALAGLPGTTTAVVSGRALRDLAELTGLPPQVQLVGSHGSEFEAGSVAALDDAASQRRTALLDAVRPLVDGIPGVLLEEKPTGVAVHVRRASRQDAATVLTSLRHGPARWAGIFATEGHEVLELSVVQSDKGHAIDELRARSGASAVIFVGDDVTDERAFVRLSGPDLGVKVGSGATAATYRVAGPDQVAALLELLAKARASWLAAAPGAKAAGQRRISP
jgi:trehalose-phosphatase